MEKEQLDGLTGLRFIAAFAIVWLHADLYFGWAKAGQNLPLILGVSFFFVLSGFILSHVYISRKMAYLSFIRARVARLWPLHAACLIAVVYLVRPDSQSLDGPGIFSKWVSFGANLALIQSWVPTTSYMFSWNSVSWSISTEMLFYASFPLLLPLLKRSAFLVLAVGALPIACLAILVPYFDIPFSGGVFDTTASALLYSFPPSRLLEFCFGMVAYKISADHQRFMPKSRITCTALELAAIFLFLAWFSWAGYIGAAFSWSPVVARWYGNAGACVVFAIIIVAISTRYGIFARMLGTSVMVKLGEISFAIYMTHQIVMKVIALSYPSLAGPAFVFLTVLIAALVGHYLIERPAQRLLYRRSRNAPPMAVSSFSGAGVAAPN